jgi:hypothetical protein
MQCTVARWALGSEGRDRGGPVMWLTNCAPDVPPRRRVSEPMGAAASIGRVEGRKMQETAIEEWASRAKRYNDGERQLENDAMACKD